MIQKVMSALKMYISEKDYEWRLPVFGLLVDQEPTF